MTVPATTGRRDPRLNDPHWLARQYRERQRSASSIARELGSTPSTVLRALDRLHIPRRTLAEANKITPAVCQRKIRASTVPEEIRQQPEREQAERVTHARTPRRTAILEQLAPAQEAPQRLRALLASDREAGLAFQEAWEPCLELAIDEVPFATTWRSIFEETRSEYERAYDRVGRSLTGLHFRTPRERPSGGAVLA